MLKPKMVTAALVAVSTVCLEYTSVAQQTTPTTQQTTPSSQPTQPTQQNQTKISTLDRQFITDAAQEWQSVGRKQRSGQLVTR